MKQQKESPVSLILILILWALGSTVSMRSVFAENAQQIEDIANVYCKDGGKIVTCVGRPAATCVSVVSPIIVECLKTVQALSGEANAHTFYNCFSLAFSAKYGKDTRMTDDCVYPIEQEGAIRPPPEEFANLGTPFFE